jgi:hypothetical protein
MEEARGSTRKASGYVNNGTLYGHQVGHSYVMEVFESVVRHEWVTKAAHGSSRIPKIVPSSWKRKAAPDEKSLTFQNEQEQRLSLCKTLGGNVFSSRCIVAFGATVQVAKGGIVSRASPAETRVCYRHFLGVRDKT